MLRRKDSKSLPHRLTPVHGLFIRFSRNHIYIKYNTNNPRKLYKQASFRIQAKELQAQNCIHKGSFPLLRIQRYHRYQSILQNTHPLPRTDYPSKNHSSAHCGNIPLNYIYPALKCQNNIPALQLTARCSCHRASLCNRNKNK